MTWLDRIPLQILIIASLTLGLAPFVPEPHIWEKLRMLAAGQLIVLGDSGKLMVAPASPKGFAPTGEAKVLGGRCWTSPVLANGRIYCRGARGDLVCLDVRP